MGVVAATGDTVPPAALSSLPARRRPTPSFETSATPLARVALVARLVWIEQLVELEPTSLDDRLDQPRRHERRRDQPGADRRHQDLEQRLTTSA
jgi:hypothetical protein